MRSTTVVHLLNLFSIMTALPLLCLTFQIFDFIVTHKMYFTIPDQKILLDPDLFWWFITGIILSFALSITAVTCEFLPSSLQQLCLRYPVSFSIGHAGLLSFGSIFCAYCSYLSTLAANGIERYVYHATPEQFRLASTWYYWKLMYCSVLFGVEALMCLGVLCTLYLGIQCRYRSLAQFPLPQKPSSTTQIDLIKSQEERKPRPSLYTQKSFKANTAFIDEQDPFNVYIMSTYYYPTSESLGNNGVALALVPPVRWMPAINNTITVRASSKIDSQTTTCTVERTNRGGWCALHSAFAGCQGVPDMTKFEISLGNDIFHEIPFKTASYEKKDVVTCIAPLFAAEQWHQIIFAAHIYRKYGTFMHLYIRSVVAPVYELIRAYEREGYLKAEPYPRIKYSSIPDYMFNPNKAVSFRAQESAQTDCLLQYKESAQYIMFVDLDDVLVPREAPTYLEEFNIYINQAEYIFYRKANVYYEASNSFPYPLSTFLDNDPEKFSIFDIFHSTRFLDKIETGKIAVVPKYVNHTMIHMVEKNRNHSGSWPMNSQNVIIHLKKAFPLGYAEAPKQLWPYFYRNDTTIFNEKDTVTIEEDYKRIYSKYQEVWKDLPSTLTYYPLILRCFNTKYYHYWYADQEKTRHQIKWCMNPDFCNIPPKLIAPCANANADYFSSEDGTTTNVHYPKNHRFTMDDRCIT